MAPATKKKISVKQATTRVEWSWTLSSGPKPCYHQFLFNFYFNPGETTKTSAKRVGACGNPVFRETFFWEN